MTTARNATTSSKTKNETAKASPVDDKQALKASQVHTIAQAVYWHLATRGGWAAWPMSVAPEGSVFPGAPPAGPATAAWPWAAQARGWAVAPPVGPAPFGFWGL